MTGNAADFTFFNLKITRQNRADRRHRHALSDGDIGCTTNNLQRLGVGCNARLCDVELVCVRVFFNRDNLADNNAIERRAASFATLNFGDAFGDDGTEFIGIRLSDFDKIR